MYMYALITEPKLPPLAGYVEDRDENDVPVYRPTEETQKYEALKELLGQTSSDFSGFMDLFFSANSGT